MTLELWRDGVQTVTEDEAVDFPVQKVEDSDRPLGYSKIQTPGVKGERTVTYEIEMKNGKEVKRTEIESVTKPVKQVEIVGTKPEQWLTLAAVAKATGWPRRASPKVNGATLTGWSKKKAAGIQTPSTRPQAPVG